MERPFGTLQCFGFHDIRQGGEYHQGQDNHVSHRGGVPGQHHHIHRHTNSIISGTYYPFGVDQSPIVFHNPNTFQFVPNVDETNQNPVSMISKNCIYVTPNASELMLWLSPMVHGVKKNESENNRVSLSFNVMIRGYVGHAESLSGVRL